MQTRSLPCDWPDVGSVDEFTHECLAIRVACKLKAIDVIDVLPDLFILQGIPAYIRSDNGPEFLAKACQDRLHRARQSLGERLHRSFNARLRDELLDGEIFYTLCEDRTHRFERPLIEAPDYAFRIFRTFGWLSGARRATMGGPHREFSVVIRSLELLNTMVN
jgi:hypothetical protein